MFGGISLWKGEGMDEYLKGSTDDDYSPNLIDNSIAPVMRVLDWVVVLVLSVLPVVNIVVMFIWAFGNTDNPNRSNFAKAFLIIIAIYMLICAIFVGQFTAWVIKAATMFG